MVVKRITLLTVIQMAICAFGFSVTVGAAEQKRIAVVQFNNHIQIDIVLESMREILATRGYTEGKTLTIKVYNAHSSFTDVAAISARVIDENYDVVITPTFPAFQAFGRANRDGKVTQVFTIVVNPETAGIGIKSLKPGDRPDHIAGVPLPILAPEALRMAKALSPSLKRVGAPYNPSDPSSQFWIKDARQTSKKLGLELLEGTVNAPSSITETINALIARRAEAIFVCADNTVLSAARTVLAIADKARVPVFSCKTTTTEYGGIFDLGVDSVTHGRELGKLVADLLDGTKPGSLPLRYTTAKTFIVNKDTIMRYRDRWKLPQEVGDVAEIIGSK